MKFNVGDNVRSIDCDITGIISSIDNDTAYIEFTTDCGGGCLPCRLDELELIPIRKATLRTFKSPHGTVNVIVQNCSHEVNILLCRFDIWKSTGHFKYDETKPRERPEIWFECPIEFLNFIESSMGRACFERMGVEEFHIEH